MPQKRISYTFQSTKAIRDAMERIMEQWDLDRTSVIKLAIYMLAGYTQAERVRRLNIFELVEDIEKQFPADFPRYEGFASGK